MTPVFGWAERTVRALCEDDPQNIAFCLSSDRSTRLYVLLAIRGWERHSANVSFAQLSHDLTRVRRRALLHHLWGFDLGSLTLLNRCSGGAWRPMAIDRLALSLGDPHYRGVLARQTRITPTLLRALNGTPIEASAAEIDLTLRYGPKVARYMLDGLSRRGSTSVGEAAAALAAVKPNAEFDEAMHRLLADTPFPPPPWAGNDSVRPLRTMRDVRRAGRHFRNCLVDVGYGLRALIQSNVLYVANLDGFEFCVRLKQDRILGMWRLVEVMGFANRNPSPAQLTKIVSRFEEEGFPYIPRLPADYWFDA